MTDVSMKAVTLCNVNTFYKPPTQGCGSLSLSIILHGSRPTSVAHFARASVNSRCQYSSIKGKSTGSTVLREHFSPQHIIEY